MYLSLENVQDRMKQIPKSLNFSNSPHLIYHRLLSPIDYRRPAWQRLYWLCDEPLNSCSHSHERDPVNYGPHPNEGAFLCMECTTIGAALTPCPS